MRVGFFQFDPAWHDAPQNLTRITTALSGRDFDLVVLPEMCTTGYLFSDRASLRAHAESVPDGPTTRAFADLARKKAAFIVAGLVESEHEQLYNTVVIVGPAGYVGKHRKRHFTALEAPLFDRGGAPVVFDLNGVIVGVAICFESWFPEVCRALALQGAQVICSPANFGGPQSLVIAQARAIENDVFFVTANRIGTESLNGLDVHFRGHSRVIGPGGDLLAESQDHEWVGIAECDPDAAAAGTLLGTSLREELKLMRS